jgi:hypothetical protein
MQVFTGEPGLEHRETLKTASHAAAAGGVTCAQGAWHRAAMPRHLQQCHGDIAKHGDIAP